uniref:Uncharacterized protein n=1 Tax=Moorena producens (strain JHB) TaxID=1454205 RepID=A0A1D9FTR1_MOOP1
MSKNTRSKRQKATGKRAPEFYSKLKKDLFSLHLKYKCYKIVGGKSQCMLFDPVGGTGILPVGGMGILPVGGMGILPVGGMGILPVGGMGILPVGGMGILPVGGMGILPVGGTGRVVSTLATRRKMRAPLKHH